jgi:hypothetical protein
MEDNSDNTLQEEISWYSLGYAAKLINRNLNEKKLLRFLQKEYLVDEYMSVHEGYPPENILKDELVIVTPDDWVRTVFVSNLGIEFIQKAYDRQEKEHNFIT